MLARVVWSTLPLDSGVVEMEWWLTSLALVLWTNLCFSVSGKYHLPESTRPKPTVSGRRKWVWMSCSPSKVCFHNCGDSLGKACSCPSGHCWTCSVWRDFSSCTPTQSPDLFTAEAPLVSWNYLILNYFLTKCILTECSQIPWSLSNLVESLVRCVEAVRRVLKWMPMDLGSPASSYRKRCRSMWLCDICAVWNDFSFTSHIYRGTTIWSSQTAHLALTSHFENLTFERTINYWTKLKLKPQRKISSRAEVGFQFTVKQISCVYYVVSSFFSDEESLMHLNNYMLCRYGLLLC